MKYYSLANILKRKAQYNLIFGERSNGKTYAVLEYALKRFISNGEQLAVIRRFREDFRGKRGHQYFKNLECNEKGQNIVKKLSSGKYDRIVYNASKWYLAYWNEEIQKIVTSEEPIAFAFALSEMEHDKSSSFPKVTTILFDEFITRSVYLTDEFVLFMNTVSTIVRSRNDVSIFMCANTVSAGRYNPYFTEMGLKHVKEMKKGDIDVYKYGDSGLIVAVEYADSPNKIKPSDVYFAFDNPKLAMITGGEWEMEIYPHLTGGINKDDIIFSYFIQFDDRTFQADIVITDTDKFTFIHDKTTPIKNDNTDIIYNLTPNEKYNYYVNLIQPVNELTKKISIFFKANKVFYQSNEIGEVISQYIQQCQKRI